MASMQCYKEEGKEFDYYSYEKSSGTYQKPTTYSNSGYGQSYYEKDKCYETKPGMMGYGASHGHQHGLGNGYGNNPCGPTMGHGKVGYGTGHNTHGMGYGNNSHSHEYGNHQMHKPGSNGLCLGTDTALGHVMGFGKKHEGHGGYGMGSSGCTTYKKQHRRRKGMAGYGSGSGSDSSDDEQKITTGFC
ncbi:hypothetical protein RND71_042984 [Anisodus tanguticus]|uniref:Uncharacterized protein n=1 Tax=Anisodus tanguticus TaxID=243964 RepID=A0AAE1UPQ0_9SOLA|nr:hypothetical protein RND71_042984 [Anisodus tanguticus]